MKRIGTIVALVVMMVSLLAPVAFAATDDVKQTSGKAGFEMLSSSPEDGTEGVAVDNFSVKIYFSKAMMPADKKIKKFNAKQFVLKNEDGQVMPTEVYYSKDEEGLLMVAVNPNSKKGKSSNGAVKGDMKYILTISPDLTASDGSKYGQTSTITLKTLNQSRSTGIYMGLMALMMVGMVFFTVRSSKKKDEEEKKKAEKGPVNPYKEAKKSGKSIEEIVAKDNKKKAKKAEAEAKRREAEAAIEAEIREKIRKEKNKRVSAPKPISAVGSTYKVTVAGEAKESKAADYKNSKGTTKPKGQSGKQKNSKKKGKKK